MNHVIIDTDIGDDIDDALALAYIVKSQQCDLVGVTTVFGDTPAKAAIAKNLLDLLGKNNVPVCFGESYSLNGERGGDGKPCQFEAVEEKYLSADYREANRFITEEAAKRTDLTILTLGPLTNIAKAVLSAPDAMAGVRLVSMAGMLGKAYPEGNVATDPEAAEIVFSSPMKKMVITLDVTLKCGILPDILKKLYSSQYVDNIFLTKMIRLWQAKILWPMLKSRCISDDPMEAGIGGHDIAAAMYLTNPELFTTRDARLLVETKGTYTRGVLVDDYDVFFDLPRGKECTVANGIDTTSFLSIFKETILRPIVDKGGVS